MGQIRIATKTLAAIARTMHADQGARYRGLLGKVLPHIGDAYREHDDAFRSHLGASVIGKECARALWYGWRWAAKKAFSGQMLRLFNRGHLEEGRLIALLLMIDCQVYQQDAEGKQMRIMHAEGHFGGSSDGVVMSLPDMPAGSPCLVEFKTHNKKSFDKLAGDNWAKYHDHILGLAEPGSALEEFTGDGVRETKFEHYVQMQIYMSKMGLPAALYVACAKDTDHIYMELVTLNSQVADEFLARGEKLVWSDRPPSKINISPGFYKCKFCDFRPVCHLGAPVERNCRTCEYSLPVQGNSWVCRKRESTIDKATQLAGCEQYKVMNDLATKKLSG